MHTQKMFRDILEFTHFYLFCKKGQRKFLIAKKIVIQTLSHNFGMLHQIFDQVICEVSPWLKKNALFVVF